MKIHLQVLVSMANEDWHSALTNTSSSMTLLKPTNLEIQFHKSVIADDPLLPNLRLIGALPSVDINVTGMYDMWDNLFSKQLFERNAKFYLHKLFINAILLNFQMPVYWRP